MSFGLFATKMACNGFFIRWVNRMRPVENITTHGIFHKMHGAEDGQSFISIFGAFV